MGLLDVLGFRQTSDTSKRVEEARKILKKIKLEEVETGINFTELKIKELEAERDRLIQEMTNLAKSAVGKSEYEKKLTAMKMKVTDDKIKRIEHDLDIEILKLNALYNIESLLVEIGKQIHPSDWEKLIDSLSPDDIRLVIAGTTRIDQQFIDKLKKIVLASGQATTITNMTYTDNELAPYMKIISDLENGKSEQEAISEHLSKRKETT